MQYDSHTDDNVDSATEERSSTLDQSEINSEGTFELDVIVKDEPDLDTEGNNLTPAIKYRNRARLTRRAPVSNSKLDLGTQTSKIMVSNPYQTIDDKEENEIFGEYVVEALKKHDKRTQCLIKHAITNILFEQEMKTYHVNEDNDNPLKL